jgi:phosphoglycerol transferase MdoB-like AlkP superfamily enzyme
MARGSSHQIKAALEAVASTMVIIALPVIVIRVLRLPARAAPAMILLFLFLLASIFKG